MFKKVSSAQVRRAALDALDRGEDISVVARAHNVSKSTLQRWQEKAELGVLAPYIRTSVLDDAKEAIVRVVAARRDATVQELAESLRSELGINISKNYLGLWLRRQDIVTHKRRWYLPGEEIPVADPIRYRPNGQEIRKAARLYVAELLTECDMPEWPVDRGYLDPDDESGAALFLTELKRIADTLRPKTPPKTIPVAEDEEE